MPPLAIELDRVSKRYSVGDRRGLLSWPRRGARERDVHWAVREVSLQVAPGESVGLIGHNGAGKTTLLRLLAGITRPSAGRVRTNGRLASLINLGAGFHPELSGRENVELNGVILGLSRREVLARFDEIVEFADLGPYIDTPLKRYSAGMVARLGFAVAAFVDPDVLLVDEVLSVGDISFQDRSIRKMLSFRDSGQAVLFVSHNLSAVEMMCQRTVWLDHGTVRLAGSTAEVVRAYLDAVDEELLREEEVSNLGDDEPSVYGAPEEVAFSAEVGTSLEHAAGEAQTADPNLSQGRGEGASSGSAQSPEKGMNPTGTYLGDDVAMSRGADHEISAAGRHAAGQHSEPPPTYGGTDGTDREGTHGVDTGTRASDEGGRHASRAEGGSTGEALAITRVSVGDPDGHATTDFEFGAQLRVSVRALARQAVREVRCTLTVRGDYGPLFSAASDVFPIWDMGAHEVTCVFDDLPLLPGLYRLEVELDHAAAPTWDKPHSISAFRVVTDLAEYGSDSVVGATKSRGGFLAVGYDWTLRTPAGEQRLPGLRTPRNMTASRRP